MIYNDIYNDIHVIKYNMFLELMFLFFFCMNYIMMIVVILDLKGYKNICILKEIV